MMTRPKRIPSETVMIHTGCGKLYVTVGRAGEEVDEVFLKLGKAGNCVPAWTEALARTMSIALQHGTPLAEIARTLVGIKCPTPGFDDGTKIDSCIDAIAKTLREAITETEEVGEDKKVKGEKG